MSKENLASESNDNVSPYWPVFKEEENIEKFWSKPQKTLSQEQLLIYGEMNRIGTTKMTTKLYFFSITSSGKMCYQVTANSKIKGWMPITAKTFIKIVELQCDTSHKIQIIKGIQIWRSQKKLYYLWNANHQLTLKWYNVLSKFAITTNFDQFYVLGEEIGHGGFSNVYNINSKASEGQLPVKFAAKVYSQDFLTKKGSMQKIQSFIRNECMILRACKSEYIMQLHEVIQLKDVVILICEFLDGCSLYSLLKQKKRLDELTVAKIFYQITQGIKVLHDQSFVHRDLKLENIMIISQDPIAIKIIDFGFAEKINRLKLESGQGTAGFIPPEIFRQLPYTEKSDLFSLGIIYYALVSGHSAFKPKNNQSLSQANKECSIDFSLAVWNKATSRTKKIVQSLVSVDPNLRYSTEKLLTKLEKLLKDEKEDQPSIQEFQVGLRVMYFELNNSSQLGKSSRSKSPLSFLDILAQKGTYDNIEASPYRISKASKKMLDCKGQTSKSQQNAPKSIDEFDHLINIAKQDFQSSKDLTTTSENDFEIPINQILIHQLIQSQHIFNNKTKLT